MTALPGTEIADVTNSRRLIVGLYGHGTELTKQFWEKRSDTAGCNCPVVITIGYYRIDRTLSCGRAGKQVQQSVSNLGSVNRLASDSCCRMPRIGVARNYSRQYQLCRPGYLCEFPGNGAA